MNILIVDDEMEIREGMERRIMRTYPDMNVMTADSAQKAIEVLRNQQIDVVFLDIMMPGVNGLELMSSVLKIYTRTKWIIVSAYSEFQFAQEALRLGAKDYIVKPIGRERLIEILRHLKEEWAQEKNRLSDQDEVRIHLKFLRETIFRRWAQGFSVEGFDITALAEQYPKFHFLFINLEREEDSLVKLFAVERIISEWIDRHGQGLLTSLDNSSLMGIIGVNPDVDFEQAKTKLAAELDRTLKAHLFHASPCLTNFSVIPDMVKHLQRKGKPSAVQESASKSEDAVELAIQYMKENFHENLSLEKVASIVYLNPIYFSQLFKQKTGIGYKSYVIRIRMERAKQLLQNRNLLIADVAEQVGYSDLAHFTYMFRKQYGLTPSDYRQSQDDFDHV
ncbi:response regulator [Paenibacillus durus]|uniref:AraC family transcriptional regulator n=1 Tax=Paenibacillus durus ATCC 35681 TaxID=1333534 RepID=A0A0F7CGX2_PAEDU|nr:response regulator [Paenibacillus durus]AKG33881.1 hypothetical protein VK70_04185 [Paenibacillus durus ATCC 35681]